MSTFDGNVAEFPDIRIDNFRPSASVRPALVYFLSHVHSDHLVGLERSPFGGPFIYCSPATREILLKLEKYPHRMNFEKGILERRVQTYRHLKKFLKPIPLDTPTVIQYAGGRPPIRVTLIDANHCVGAVMFLIEGDGKAVLYTGDIRSEQWWVDSLSRHPVLIPYVAYSGQTPLKQLDTVYLDTTFATKDNPYKHFPSKAEGIRELLGKVKEYPKDTLFHFNTWTFGYEEVWQALSSFAESRIHIDVYRYKLYEALTYNKERELATIHKDFKQSLGRSAEAFKLIGSQVGNDYHPGCLSSDTSCRLHTCEKGTRCEIWSKSYVTITPIISRHEGKDMLELGAGGGQYDLNQRQELEVDDPRALLALCFEELKDDPQKISSICKMIGDLMQGSSNVISFDQRDLRNERESNEYSHDGSAPLDDIPLKSVVSVLLQRAAKLQDQKPLKSSKRLPPATFGLPAQITFPYSRHSSYTELCALVGAFMPKNIYPCTVSHEWKPNQSMEYLYGHLYEQRPQFTHDQAMLQQYHGDNEEDHDASDAGSPDRYAQMETQEFEEALQARNEIKASRSRSASANQHRDKVEHSGNHGHRSKRRKTEPQGDFWPPRQPLGRDHYSPPPCVSPPRKSKSSTRQSPLVDTTTHETRPQPESRESKCPGELSRREKIVEATKLLGKQWSQPSHVEQRQESPSRQINRWQKLIAQSQARDFDENPLLSTSYKQQAKGNGRPASADRHDTAEGRESRNRIGRRQSIEHGRLSPPPAEYEPGDNRPRKRGSQRRSSEYGPSPPPPDHGARMRMERNHGVFSEAYQPAPGPSLPADYGRLSPPPVDDEQEDVLGAVELSEADVNFALKQEAYDAAMGNGGLDWSSISLVSVRGHQVKEEEL